MDERTRRTDRDGSLEEARHFLHLADQAQASSNRALAIQYLELALAALDEVAAASNELTERRMTKALQCAPRITRSIGWIAPKRPERLLGKCQMASLSAR
jgi:hypothetical protein